MIVIKYYNYLVLLMMVKGQESPYRGFLPSFLWYLRNHSPPFLFDLSNKKFKSIGENKNGKNTKKEQK